MTRPAACLALLLACAAPARADIVTYRFTATEGVSGKPVSGSFTYDTSSPDLLPPDPHHAEYRETGLFEYRFRQFTVRSRGFYYLDIYDNSEGTPAFHDNFRITAPHPVVPQDPRGNYLFALFTLEDSTDRALSGVSPPASLDLGAFDTRVGYLRTEHGPIGIYHVNTLTATPEPSTLALLGLGGAALAARGPWRRRPAR